MPLEINMGQFVEKIETLADPQTDYETRVGIAQDLLHIRSTLLKEKQRPALRSIISQVLDDSGVSYDTSINHASTEAGDSH